VPERRYAAGEDSRVVAEVAQMAPFSLAKAVCRVAVPLGVVLAVLVQPGFASATGSLTLTGSYTRATSTSGQGLATLSAAGGSTSIVYRGDWSIPLRLLLQGWQHIGDPGAGGYPGKPRGYLFDAYQGSATATSKMFEVTTPTGKHYDFVHKLASGEAYNNSFATISPNGKWLVSGEWGTMSRFLVLPAPLLNSKFPASSAGVNLPLVGYINLTSPVQNIQGCDFQSDTVLLCSSDGTPEEILQVNLSQPVSGANDSGSVAALADLPQNSNCTGTFEAEGIDYYKSQVRVEVIPPSPCSTNTTVYVYTYG
jgi:hypothetical protein